MSDDSHLSHAEIQRRLQRLRNLEAYSPTLVAKNRALKAENKALKAEAKILRARVEALELRLEELTRMVFGRKRPPSSPLAGSAEPDGPSDPPAPRPASSYRRPLPPPEAVTAVVRHPLPRACPGCGGSLTTQRIQVTYVEDLVLPQKSVTRHDAPVATCGQCHRTVRSLPPPSQTVTLGPNVRMFVAVSVVNLRQSYEQIVWFLTHLCGIEISDGEIASILTGEATAFAPERERIAERIRAAPGAHYDETSWHVQDRRVGQFGWVKVSTEGPERIVILGRSRGKGVAEELRGEPSEQVAISDDYAVFDHLEDAHQRCWAHPHRKLRDLASSTTLPTRSRTACIRAFDAFKDAYRMVRTVLASPSTKKERQAVEGIVRSLLVTFSRIGRYDPPALRRMKTTLGENLEPYLTCLRVPGIPADNNAAERALRPLVLKRKNSFGSKTARGADTLATLWSVLATIAARKPAHFFAAYAAARG